ncbi:hypothetical protein KC19_11G065200 [Ceratodon purpureus]|uniref:TIR domain-containing protein n=1 Tax=Ceratodon purpureus TaxID=3225 RepID=A0A8T0GFJ2_CERPU|nr:hypothetical protein KC19_11G065200 [Ceratodon purpureus]
MESLISTALPWLFAVLAVIGGIALFKSAYNADSQQPVKASENGRGTRAASISPKRNPQQEPELEADLHAERQHDPDPKLQPKHKIFLSHSGAQKDFVEQLCEDLERFHRFPFFDKREDSLPKGERFPDLIFQAAKQCRVAVVVVSEEFFTRTKWPMLELDAFVKAQKERNGYPRILPLFFKLSRAQCRESARRELGLEVWRGWARHDSKIVVEDWVNALDVFGPINGLEYRSEGEVSYRRAARSAIIRLVPPELQFDTTSYQGSERFCKLIVDKLHEVEASTEYGVRVVGVYGVGGLGKTSVCKALYNSQYAECDGKVCLVELGGLSPEELQKQVLRELTQLNPELEKDLRGDKVVRLLKERLHKHKVFLAIGNVWDSSVSRDTGLTFLQAGFHCDSMVLVTARTRDILVRLGIDENHCMEMPELDKEEATKLFLHHALPYYSQLEGPQRDVVEQCVERCWFHKGGAVSTARFQYVPLAIKVLAGQLGESSKDPLDWREQMSKPNFNLSQERVHPIFSILRTGYDSLSVTQQLLFMDVALFCPRPNSQLPRLFEIGHEAIIPGNVFYWLSLLHNRSLSDTKEDLQILKRRSLVEDLGDGLSRITLHDLYYEFAVNESQAMDFSERRWLFADYKTLSKMTGMVFPSTADIPEDLQRIPGLSCWPALRRIAISNIEISSLDRTELHYCSNVVLLKLVNCPDIKRAELHDLGCLKFLEVAGCWKLEASSLGIEGMRKLVWLRWSGSSLRYPCFPDLSLLKSLRVLELVRGWDSPKSLLSSLPGLDECVNLVELTLSEHRELDAFPDLSRMVLLAKVWFVDCGEASGLRGLSSKMTQLQELRLYHCDGIVELPGVEELVSLKKLQLDSFKFTVSSPDLKKLTNLDDLMCSGFSFKKSRRMKGLDHREELRCNEYDDLLELPDLSSLRGLRKLHLSYCNVESLHEFHISHLTNLQILKCEWLEALTEVPDLSTLSQIRVISFYECSKLRSVVEGNIDRLTTLQSLDVSFTAISMLPDLSQLKDLRALQFCYTCVTALPKDFARLATIPDLRMWGCTFLRIPLLELLGERVPEVQELAAMEALDNIYHVTDLDNVEEGPHPSALSVRRLLECVDCSTKQSRLRESAVSLLSTMCLDFQSTTNRGFNTKVLETLGEVEGGVESVIRVFCEEEDIESLLYVIVGFIFIGHRCSALRASDTPHKISRIVIRFGYDDPLLRDLKFYLSVVHCLEIMFEDPVVARAFGDQVAIDFLEKLRLLGVKHNLKRMSSVFFERISRFYNLGLITSATCWSDSESIAHKLKQLYLAKIDALLDKARLEFLSPSSL